MLTTDSSIWSGDNGKAQNVRDEQNLHPQFKSRQQTKEALHGFTQERKGKEMKLKCKVCGKRFLPHKETTYLVQEELSGLAALSATNRVYDAADCPRCGSQLLLGIRVPLYKERNTENENESDA